MNTDDVSTLKAQCCRQCRDQEPPVQTRAEFILWGKLFAPEAFGPKCYDHAAEHIGWAGMSMIDQYAVYDLRPINALIDGSKVPMTWDIWSEGYRATGEHATAKLVASGIEAETFQDAVLQWADSPAAWEDMDRHFNRETLVYWNCRFFPTEDEARRSHG